MPQRDSAPAGAPCWVDLFTSEPKKAEYFYGRLFGWSAESAGEQYGGYVNFFKHDRPVAGAMKNDGAAGTPDVWSVYLAVDDAKATADAATSAGGAIVVAPMEVTEQGTMAVLTDVGGATIGVWQPDRHKGFGLVDEPGTPAWFELDTREYDASVGFYRKVFGWDTHVLSDTEDFRYTTLGEGDAALAGIGDGSAFLPKGAPGAWSVYFRVEDADTAVAQVEELGGSIVQPPEDSPYGRLARLADPTGAVFKIIAG